MMAPLLNKDMALFPAAAPKKKAAGGGKRPRAQSVAVLTGTAKARQPPLRAHSASVGNVSEEAARPQPQQQLSAPAGAGRNWNAVMATGRTPKRSINEACRLESVREAENECTSSNLAALRRSSERHGSGDTQRASADGANGNSNNNGGDDDAPSGGIDFGVAARNGARGAAPADAADNGNANKRTLKDRTKTFFRKLTGSAHKDSS